MATTKRPLAVWLDYGPAATPELLGNLSAAAFAGRFLWTASDEDRTVECLEPDGKGGYRLHQQYVLDTLFAAMPGRVAGDELDIEALSVSGGRLWLCGSHSRVRRNHKDPSKVDARFRARESRCFLGWMALTKDGGTVVGHGTALPFTGPRSLRSVLRRNPYIKPFIELPSKENGLDIEGVCVSDRQLYLGLRGPVVDSKALAIAFPAARAGVLGAGKPVTHFLNLGGLGIRDLTQHGDDILVMAGPVSAADGPFRLYHWRPAAGPLVQHPQLLHEWTSPGEHPEGMSLLTRAGKKGVLVVYDAPTAARVAKHRYRADWLAL